MNYVQYVTMYAFKVKVHYIARLLHSMLCSVFFEQKNVLSSQLN